MARDDPFAGIPLSEQTGAGKLEQRLFTPEVPPLSPGPEQAATSGQPKPDEKSASQELDLKKEPAPKHAAAVEHFDLGDQPLYQASFLFTSEELERLEDLKLELRREYDTKVTKNNLIRCALHMLLEDHEANGSRSYASRKIRRL